MKFLKHYIKKIPFVRNHVIGFLLISKSKNLKAFIIFLLLFLVSRFFRSRSDYFEINSFLIAIFKQYNLDYKGKKFKVNLLPLDNGLYGKLDNLIDIKNELEKRELHTRSFLYQNKISSLEFELDGIGDKWYKSKEQELKILNENYYSFRENNTLIGYDWYQALGHICLLGYLGLAYPKKFTIIVIDGESVANKKLLKIIMSKFNIIKMSPMIYAGLNISQPNLFHTVDSTLLSKGEDPIRHLVGSCLEELRHNNFKDQIKNQPLKDLLPYQSYKNHNIFPWYVTLHIRGNSFHRVNDPNSHPRDANIITYKECIKFIINNGGNVIRIGEKGSATIKNINGFIDLTQYERDISNDINLIANARFHIGTASGPTNIPPLFGVPILLTNLVRPVSQSQFPRSLAITKKWFNKSTQKYISYNYCLNTQLAGKENKRLIKFKDEEIILQDNTSEEILLATKDMLDLCKKETNESYEIYNSILNEYTNYLKENNNQDIPPHMPPPPSFLNSIKQLI
tara:strand:- start:2757 stop:4289 length:1533 start_codon:yes stop_codon:yes gene_type:complete